MNYLFGPAGEASAGMEEAPAAATARGSQGSPASCRPCVVANVLWGVTVLAAIGAVVFMMMRARRQQQQRSLHAATVLPLPPLPVRPKAAVKKAQPRPIPDEEPGEPAGPAAPAGAAADAVEAGE